MTTENLTQLAGNLLTVKETMAALKVGRTKLYELINAGAIEVVKFGRRSTGVKASSLEKLIANGIA